MTPPAVYLLPSAAAPDKDLYHARLAAARHSSFRSWKELCRHYGNRCLCCGRSGQRLTKDHVIPRSWGGTSNLSNLQPLCAYCNGKKGDRVADYRPAYNRLLLLEIAGLTAG